MRKLNNTSKFFFALGITFILFGVLRLLGIIGPTLTSWLNLIGTTIILGYLIDSLRKNHNQTNNKPTEE